MINQSNSPSLSKGSPSPLNAINKKSISVPPAVSKQQVGKLTAQNSKISSPVSEEAELGSDSSSVIMEFD